jgi:transposase-like protein
LGDGVNVSVRRGEDPKLCLLVVIGVREDGEKELLAVEDGYRESEDSWAAVFRDLRDRGLRLCPKMTSGPSKRANSVRANVRYCGESRPSCRQPCLR